VPQQFSSSRGIPQVLESRVTQWATADGHPLRVHEQASFSLAVPGPLGGGRAFFIIAQLSISYAEMQAILSLSLAIIPRPFPARSVTVACRQVPSSLTDRQFILSRVTLQIVTGRLFVQATRGWALDRVDGGRYSFRLGPCDRSSNDCPEHATMMNPGRAISRSGRP